MLKNNYDCLLVLIMLIFAICLGIGSLFLNNDDSTKEIALSANGSTLITEETPSNENRNPYELTVIGYDNSYNIMWICNNYTKVVYVTTYETYRSAKPHLINIIPLLNADGTPVTYSEETWS